ncbi:MAG: ATP-binding cassette domain-containing protein [Rhodobacteraceae bacterium]|nr:ATP-binding cassette domain-containing protein [Paracoccaceae bacterium]
MKQGPYKRLWHGWLKHYRGALALGFLGMLIGALASAGYAKALQWVIDAFEASERSVIWWGPLLMIALTSSKGLGTWLFQVNSNAALVRTETDLQKAMHKKLVFADLAQIQGESPTALSTRFTADIMLVRQSVIQIFGGVSAVLILVATVAVMLSIDWVITLTLVAVFSLAVYPVNRIGGRLHVVSRETQDDLAKMTGEISEALGSIRMARAYQLEPYLQRSAGVVFDRLLGLKLRLIRLEARLAPIMETLSGAAIAALLVVVAWRLSNGTTTLANFMALMAGFGVISQPARNLGKTFAMAKQGEAALDRIFEILDLQSTIKDPAKPTALTKGKGTLSFQSVGFSYPDGKVALHDISLDVPAGAMVAFVGRSGAGKSTIFNLLPRLFDVSEGRIMLDGIDIRDLTQADLRSQIALVSQESVLLSGSIGQNIGFGREGADAVEIEAAAKAAAAHSFITALPQGYNTPVMAAASTLSGGEKQRISIARAMLRNAPVLLLDEPTSALDAESEAVIKQALSELSKGRTTLVIAHRLATIREADIIVVLDQGRIAETGNHTDLLAKDGIYAELFRLQFSG